MIEAEVRVQQMNGGAQPKGGTVTAASAQPGVLSPGSRPVHAPQMHRAQRAGSAGLESRMLPVHAPAPPPPFAPHEPSVTAAPLAPRRHASTNRPPLQPPHPNNLFTKGGMGAHGQVGRGEPIASGAPHNAPLAHQVPGNRGAHAPTTALHRPSSAPSILPAGTTRQSRVMARALPLAQNADQHQGVGQGHTQANAPQRPRAVAFHETKDFGPYGYGAPQAPQPQLHRAPVARAGGYPPSSQPQLRQQRPRRGVF